MCVCVCVCVCVCETVSIPGLATMWGVNRYRYLLTKKAVALVAVAESDIRLVDVYDQCSNFQNIHFAVVETCVFDRT